jgi:hypothetical protein
MADNAKEPLLCQGGRYDRMLPAASSEVIRFVVMAYCCWLRCF